MKAVSTGPERQRGYFTLISAGVAVTVFGILMAIQASQHVSKSRNDAAKSAGVLAGQYKNALRAAVAREGTALATGTYTGTGWLKRAGACTGASGSQAYLPCEFPSHLPLGLAYRTTVSVSGAVVRARVSLGAPESGGETYPYLAGNIVTAINGASNDHVTPVTQTYHVAEHDTAGNITITVSNGPENNEYLKRDGSVRPTDNFDWGGFDLTNVDRIDANRLNANSINTGSMTATGSIRGSTIYGTQFIDTNTYSGEQFYVNPSLNSKLRGTLSVGSNITADGTLNAEGVRLSRSESEGGSCSGYSVGFTGSRELLVCNSSNRWERVGSGEPRFYARNTSLISLAGFLNHASTFTRTLSIPDQAYAAQITAFCAMLDQGMNQVRFRVEDDYGERDFLWMESGGSYASNVESTSMLVSVRDSKTLRFRYSGPNQCDGNGGLQVRMTGYFTN